MLRTAEPWAGACASLPQHGRLGPAAALASMPAQRSGWPMEVGGLGRSLRQPPAAALQQLPREAAASSGACPISDSLEPVARPCPRSEGPEGVPAGVQVVNARVLSGPEVEALRCNPDVLAPAIVAGPATPARRRAVELQSWTSDRPLSLAELEAWNQSTEGKVHARDADASLDAGLSRIVSWTGHGNRLCADVPITVSSRHVAHRLLESTCDGRPSAFSASAWSTRHGPSGAPFSSPRGVSADIPGNSCSQPPRMSSCGITSVGKASAAVPPAVVMVPASAVHACVVQTVWVAGGDAPTACSPAALYSPAAVRPALDEAGISCAAPSASGPPLPRWFSTSRNDDEPGQAEASRGPQRQSLVGGAVQYLRPAPGHAIEVPVVPVQPAQAAQCGADSRRGPDVPDQRPVPVPSEEGQYPLPGEAGGWQAPPRLADLRRCEASGSELLQPLPAVQLAAADVAAAPCQSSVWSAPAAGSSAPGTMPDGARSSASMQAAAAQGAEASVSAAVTLRWGAPRAVAAEQLRCREEHELPQSASNNSVAVMLMPTKHCDGPLQRRLVKACPVVHVQLGCLEFEGSGGLGFPGLFETVSFRVLLQLGVQPPVRWAADARVSQPQALKYSRVISENGRYSAKLSCNLCEAFAFTVGDSAASEQLAADVWLEKQTVFEHLDRILDSVGLGNNLPDYERTWLGRATVLLPPQGVEAVPQAWPVMADRSLDGPFPRSLSLAMEWVTESLR